MLQSPTSASASSWTRVSPLEILITRACDPSLHEPNYAMHLEVAEYINNKKANNPREAAMLLARLANNRNPHISLLSLSLLQTLVSSCGYPFHLQISTKEFLNELVRRFPERPPPYPNAVMGRILELIAEWKDGICVESRWKEDLGNIRDMYRLLTFKGYRFRSGGSSSSHHLSSSRPNHAQSDAEASVTANLKTASQLELEDREAQSAKLQELIRRGTPRDLALAQELMKSLAGAVPDENKPDYKGMMFKEVEKLEAKVVLLNEMLDNVHVDSGTGKVIERMVEGDAYDQVAGILKAARPKLQKWVEEAGEAMGTGNGEGGDSEELDTFLQMNDQINSVLTRYESFKKGDYVAAANPIPSELSTNSNAGGPSLIDLDLDFSATATQSTATNGGGNDLAGLFSSTSISNTNNAMPVMESRIGLGLPGMNVASSASAPSTPGIPYQGTGGIGQQGMGMGLGGMMGNQQRTYTPPTPSLHTMGSMSGLGLGVGTTSSSSMGMGMGQRTYTPPIPQQQQQQQRPFTQTPPSYSYSSPAQQTVPAASSPAPNYFSPQSTAQGPAPTQAPVPTQQGTKDPFADLAGLF